MRHAASGLYSFLVISRRRRCQPAGRVRLGSRWTGFQGTLLPGISGVCHRARSWIGFLSLVGICNIQESASTQVDAVKDSTVQQLNDLKSKLDGLVCPGVSQGSDHGPQAAQADLSKEISERFDSTLREVSAGFNNAKVRIREDARRVF